MKKLGALILMALLSFSVQAIELDGVNLPDKIKAPDGKELLLNGAGMREKWFLDLYVGALYLEQHQSDAAKILKANEDMAIHLKIVSGMITSERFSSATLEGFENSMHGNTAPLKTQIDSFMETFKEPIKKGDVFEMVYVPNTGVQIYKNGTLKNTIAGEAFKEALFGIWLSDKPAQESLKKEMLGKKS